MTGLVQRMTGLDLINVPLRPAAAGGAHSHRIYIGSSPVPLLHKMKRVIPDGITLFMVRMTGLDSIIVRRRQAGNGNSPPDCCI